MIYTRNPGAFSDKIMPDRNYFTDEPVVQCDVLVVKKYFCALLEIKMQMINNRCKWFQINFDVNT